MTREVDMAIITISRGSYSHGKEIANKLARKLGYRCVSREALIRASKEFNIPEIKLEKALHDSPSVLERFTYGKQRYLAYIRTSILEFLVHDNTVYHGLAGHAFVPNVQHKLSIRICAKFEDRLKEEMERMHLDDIEKAKRLLKNDDEERRKWGFFVVGRDPYDISSYDLVYNVSKIHVDDVVDSVSYIVKLPYMKTTNESPQIMNDALLAAKCKAKIVNQFPYSTITADKGHVSVSLQASLSQEDKIIENIHKILENANEVKSIKINIVPRYEA